MCTKIPLRVKLFGKKRTVHVFVTKSHEDKIPEGALFYLMYKGWQEDFINSSEIDKKMTLQSIRWSGFLETRCVGDSFAEHPDRMYILVEN